MLSPGVGLPEKPQTRGKICPYERFPAKESLEARRKRTQKKSDPKEGNASSRGEDAFSGGSKAFFSEPNHEPPQKKVLLRARARQHIQKKKLGFQKKGEVAEERACCILGGGRLKGAGAPFFPSFRQKSLQSSGRFFSFPTTALSYEKAFSNPFLTGSCLRRESD